MRYDISKEELIQDLARLQPGRPIYVQCSNDRWSWSAATLEGDFNLLKKVSSDLDRPYYGFIVPPTYKQGYTVYAFDGGAPDFSFVFEISRGGEEEIARVIGEAGTRSSEQRSTIVKERL